MFGILDNCTKVPHHVDPTQYQSSNCAKILREVFYRIFLPVRYKLYDTLYVNMTINHIRSDPGSEFRSNTFRKWCSERKIRFTTAVPKHQEQNGLVEKHWGTIVKMTNTMILHARLSKRFFYYAAKYSQRVHDVIPV